MSSSVRDTLLRQFDIGWSLAAFHLDGLTTEECLWRPAAVGLHVQQRADGEWVAEWPEDESYHVGPPSIAWTTWHLGFWWSMTLDHSAGDGTLARGDVLWPGTADGVRGWISELHERWVAFLTSIDDAEFASTDRTRWPFTDRPFSDVAAWVNMELTKNAAEIGYGRFLYAVRDR